jgi:dihydroxyacetone kinase DhaKLM complex PTS-EIIA-like component DhaM
MSVKTLPTLGSAIMNLQEAQRFAQLSANELNCDLIVFEAPIYEGGTSFDVAFQLPSFGTKIDLIHPNKEKHEETTVQPDPVRKDSVPNM